MDWQMGFRWSVMAGNKEQFMQSTGAGTAEEGFAWSTKAEDQEHQGRNQGRFCAEHQDQGILRKGPTRFCADHQGQEAPRQEPRKVMCGALLRQEGQGNTKGRNQHIIGEREIHNSK
jgi:hypothetical protein